MISSYEDIIGRALTRSVTKVETQYLQNCKKNKNNNGFQ